MVKADTKPSSSGTSSQGNNGSSLIPEVIKQRTNALRHLQLKINDVEGKMSEELHKLECKYAKMFDPLFDQREKIVNGEYEPTGEEIQWPYETNSEFDYAGGDAGATKTKKQKTGDEIKGVPGFWHRVIGDHMLLGNLITEQEEPIIDHLRDIRIKLSDEKQGYTISFHFNSNEYFTNTVLSKTIELNLERNPKNPLGGVMSRIRKSVGTKIDWKDGKKPSSLSGADSDEYPRSFFDFFATHNADGVNPWCLEQPDESDDAANSLCQRFEFDFEACRVFKDSTVPNAVLYFTGEAPDMDLEGDDLLDDDDEDDEDDDEDDDDDDDEDDDDDDEEEDLKRRPAKKSSK